MAVIKFLIQIVLGVCIYLPLAIVMSIVTFVGMVIHTVYVGCKASRERNEHD